ncbi:hypothetical protein Taro_011121 [Colocasia esculenta]|uniref:Uncharacterized protein n=1 Tax=Colocasia esculenta TaxID=4460 RepID=A0A843UA24_COLES|nr:hypothetical protein [Colocasia esculenta]
MRSGARWAARQFVPLDGGVRGLGRLQPRREPENLLGTLWEHSPSRVVPRSRVTVPVRNPFAVVRRGRADDMLGDIPPRGLTVSDQGGWYLGDLKTVLKKTWPVEMGPRLLTGHARAVVGHRGTRWSDLATTLSV